MLTACHVASFVYVTNKLVFYDRGCSPGETTTKNQGLSLHHVTGILSSNCPHNIIDSIFQIHVFKSDIAQIEIFNEPFEMTILSE